MSGIGQVSVFNAGTQNLTLTLNTVPFVLPAGTVDQTSGVYHPGLKMVSRDPSPQPGGDVFGGANTLMVTVPGQAANTYQIPIPAEVFPLDQNLQLWIYYTGAVLSWSGRVVWQQMKAVSSADIARDVAEFRLNALDSRQFPSFFLHQDDTQ